MVMRVSGNEGFLNASLGIFGNISNHSHYNKRIPRELHHDKYDDLF